jgi:hypothetical protein
MKLDIGATKQPLSHYQQKPPAHQRMHLKLMSHTMKLWERIIKYRLRGVINVTENQFDFMPGRSIMETIFLIRQLMKRYIKQEKDLYMVFIDLKKVYDKVSRNIM